MGEVWYVPAVSDHNNITDVSKTSTDISKMVSRLLEKNDSVESKLSRLNKDLKEYIELLQLENIITDDGVGNNDDYLVRIFPEYEQFV